MTYSPPEREATLIRPTLPASLALVAAYALLTVAGMWLLRTPHAMRAGSELSVPRTVFTVCNAASLTGFQQSVAVESYRPLGQAVVFSAMLAGSLLSMIVGAAAAVRVVHLQYSMRRIVAWALGAHLLAIAAGAAALIGPDRGFFPTAFQAVSALANCGVVIGPVSPMHSLSFQLFVLPLSIFGGIGLSVLMELYDWPRRRRRLSTHARVVLGMTAGVYVVGFVMLLWLNRPGEVPQGSTLASEMGGAVVGSSTTALNARSLGWPVESPANWPRAAVWVVLLLMLIGASPGGTGGGVKTTTLFVLSRGIGRIWRGDGVGRIFAVAIVWFAAFAALALLATMYLVSTQPQLPAEQALFIAVSALGNAGLSYAPISITGEGLFGLSIAMMLGRLLPLAVLWWAALTVRDADVAVG